MKKQRLLSLFLALALLLGLLAGCTGSSGSASSATPSSSAPAEPTPDEKAAAIEAAFEWDFSPVDADGNMLRTGRSATGETGVVTSGKVEASRAGLQMLIDGGNAVDAAVATSFALAVCEPSASGLGGGGFMLIHTEDGKSVFLDGREIAPQNATPDLWPVDAEGKVINNVKTEGGTANCVPTFVATLLYALENYGTMSRAEVLAPAIALAEDGFEVSAVLASDIEYSMAKLNTYNNGEGAKIYLKDGFPLKVGDVVVNTDLAKTLKIISDKGLAGFYEGEVAEAIVAANNESGGVMTLEDLKTAAATQPVVREPVTGTYRDYQIISAPPVSSGGTHIIEMLNILEHYDMSSYAVNSYEYMHLFSEVFKMAFADRAKYMGDPAFVEGGVPVDGLTSKEYSDELAKLIDLKLSGSYSAGDAWAYESNDTTHFSVGDASGNMVAMTQTVNGYFGSGVFPTSYGFPLNNQCSDFGIGWGKPNSVEGGKKPLSSMSPTIVLTPEGEPFAVLGSPGATKIFTTVAQMIVKLVDYKMDIQDAVDSPRIWDSNAENVLYEDAIDSKEIQKLVDAGHAVTETPMWSRSLGSVNGILYGDDDVIYGAGDPRRDGKALGY